MRTASRAKGGGPEPIGWQDPDVTWKPRTIDLTFAKGPEAGLRTDAGAVYGEIPAEDAVTRAWARERSCPAPGSEIRAALRRAERHRPVSDEQALALFQAEGVDLDALRGVADGLRQEAVGDVVTYVINRNINFTNVCYVGCRFCAFAQREVDPEAYTLTLDEVADRAEEAWAEGRARCACRAASTPTSRGPSIWTSSTR